MVDPNTPAGRLTLARIKAGYPDLKSFWSAHGIPQGTYSHHEAGTRGLTQKAAKKYARLLNCTPVWLLFGEGEGPSAQPEGVSALPPDQAGEAPRRHNEVASFLLLYDRLTVLAGEHDQGTAAEFGIVFQPFGYEKGPRGIVQLAFHLWLDIASEGDDVPLPERALKKIADLDNALRGVKETLRQVARLTGRQPPKR